VELVEDGGQAMRKYAPLESSIWRDKEGKGNSMGGAHKAREGGKNYKWKMEHSLGEHFSNLTITPLFLKLFSWVTKCCSAPEISKGKSHFFFRGP